MATFARALATRSSSLGVAAAAAAGACTVMYASEGRPAQSAGSLMAQISEISSKVAGIEKALGSGESEVAEKFLFTSESVNEGHPDKLADQASAQRPRNTTTTYDH